MSGRQGLEPGVAVWRCRTCGRQAFPLRLRCPSCGSADGETVRAERGRLAEQTVVRRAVGGELEEPVRIGTVELDGGAVIVARIDGELADGEWVALFSAGEAPVAGPA